MAIAVPLWELREITKRFPGVVANDRVSLRLYAGEIHGLDGRKRQRQVDPHQDAVGRLSARRAARILKRGEAVVLASPIAAREAGIATVFQEFSVVPTLSVAENIFLGRWPKRRVARRLGRHARQARAKSWRRWTSPSTSTRSSATCRSPSSNWSRSPRRSPRTPPCSSWTSRRRRSASAEIARLHGLLRRLRERGRSHPLHLAPAGRGGGARRQGHGTEGRQSRRQRRGERDLDSLHRREDGRRGRRALSEGADAARRSRACSVEDLVTRNRVAGVSFAVRRGEVFGIGGVLGSGRTEVARALFGLDRADRAARSPGRARRSASARPRQAIAAGLALVPENRKFDGLFFNFAGFPNMTVRRPWIGSAGMAHQPCARGGGRARADRATSRSRQPPRPRRSACSRAATSRRSSSRRWLFAGAELFILDEPTQGIDIGAKIAVYRLINRLTAAGKAVILISSDHDELLAMSDRIGIMSHGRMVDGRATRASVIEDRSRPGSGRSDGGAA